MLSRVITALLAGAALASCSVVFSESGGPEAGTDDAGLDAGPNPEICEGEYRQYQRGVAVPESKARYERFDSGQGTITFWVRALEQIPEGQPIPLLELNGVRITTDSLGRFTVQMRGLEGNQTFDELDHSWEVGEDLFVALRWDADREISGDPLGRHLMLHVGQERQALVDAPYPPEVDTGAGPHLRIGDEEGHFNVDQLVVYDRPLYVDDDVNSPENELIQLAANKRDSAVLVRGGLEVSFATMARQTGACNAPGADGWGMPLKSEVLGDIREGDFTGWSVSGPAVPTPPKEISDSLDKVYRTGLAVEPLTSVYASVELRQARSYVFFALAHGDALANALPGVSIFVMDGKDRVQPALVTTTSEEGTADRPAFLFGTFEMPGNLANIEIELANTDPTASADAFFHTVHIFENSIANASFERPICESLELVCDVSEGWEEDLDGARAYIVNAERDPAGILVGGTGTGDQAACFDGSGQRSNITTVPGGAFDSGAIYATGVAAYWPTSDPKSEPPRIEGAGGASGLLSTGLPASEDKPASASAAFHDRWHVLGAAAYYEEGSRKLRIGPQLVTPADLADSCVDDAYFFALDSIRGQ